MNPLILKYSTVILLDEGCNVPDELSNLPCKAISGKKVSSLMQEIEEIVDTEYILLITNSESVARYVSVFNMTRQNHHIAVLKNGILDADEALKEYEYMEMQLVDENGNEYFLDKQIAPYVFSTKEGRIVCDTRFQTVSCVDACTQLYYKSSGDKLGILLPDKYQAWKFIGTMEDYTARDMETSLMLLKNLLYFCDGRKIPQQVLFFEDEVCITKYNETPTGDEVKCFTFKMLFGSDVYSNDAMSYMIASLVGADVPNYVLDFLEEQFIDSVNADISKWNNILERYCLDKEAV